MAVFCPNCGSTIDEGSKFCQKCGTPSPQPTATAPPPPPVQP
ncbi:MAG: zinc-ribbon domain-containing protein, partial [Terriglobia bacterium]